MAVDLSEGEYSLPAPLVPIAVRLANEGIPVMVIARSLRQPSEIVRSSLDDAILAGAIVEMPRDDWPPTAKLADRLPSSGPKAMDDDTLLALCMKVFKVTRLQAALLVVLLKRDSVTKETLHNVIEAQRVSRMQKPNNMDETDLKMVDVIICHIRKKIKPFSLVVTTLHGVGYFMSRDDRNKALDLIKAAISTG